MDDAKTLNAVKALQKRELSIIKLAEPILSNGQSSTATGKRGSDASANASDNPTPASLSADLLHYKELFSKLRFSYLEQVTKEKFIRAIVEDPPLIVEHEDNVALEKQLAESKSSLKAQKEEVEAMKTELEAIGRDLSSRYETVQLQTTQLSSLPAEILSLEKTVARLKEQQGNPKSGDASQTLPLPATLELLSSRDAEAEQLDAQILALQTSIPRKARELERLESELRPLEMQKQQAISSAREAIRRKENGEKRNGDELELKGRWYAGAQTAMGNILQAEV